MESEIRKAFIYKITSPSGKVYIGRTYDIKRRMRDYRAYRCVNQTKLLSSLLKYTFEAHTVSILFEGEVSEQDLFRMEEDYIREHGSNVTGLNVLKGGCGFKGITPRSGFHLTDDTKRKISEKRKGYRHSEESKALMRKNCSMKNPVHKAKMIDQVKKAFTPELRSHLSQKQKEIKAVYNPLSKGVVQLDSKGAVVREYKSTHEAASLNGTRNSNISAVCRGERKSHLGFVWAYSE